MFFSLFLKSDTNKLNKIKQGLGERSHSPRYPSLWCRGKQGKRTEITQSLNELCTLQQSPYTNKITLLHGD